ncbi:MAG TPA: hypothetical protein DD671_10845 [Balneolaceae bacterium]|nr:hypothetical protein [Balneolaceae bacterium]
MQEMMQDSTMRSMMMDHMAQNPEMRKQMMQKMMGSMKMDSTMMMHDGEMDHSKMMEMMGNSSMMKMHMMCMQIVQGNMMDGEGMMNKKDGMKSSDHQKHHN